MEKRCLLLASLLFLTLFSFGQALEANYWYFGYGSGLKFSPNGPVPELNGIHRGTNGVASISNEKGQLLFYADRSNIYNSKHDTLKNGKSIFVSAQNLIVKQPLSNTKYWLFTLGNSPNCQYNLIDINADSGFGEVIKGGFLNAAVESPGISVLDHINGRDKWIVLKSDTADAFYSYKLTNQGLHLASPKVSFFGPKIFKSTYNAMKSSPNSEYLAISYRYPRKEFAVYKFNKSTGDVKKRIFGVRKSDPNSEVFGLTFSSNSEILFVCRRNKLFAYDLSSEDSMIIKNTELLVDSNININHFIWDLQLGLDGAIYFINQKYQTTKKISRLLCPDQVYKSIQIEDTILTPLGIVLGTKLPTLNQTLYVNTHKLQAQSLEDTVLCSGDSTTLTAYGAAADQFIWSPATGLSCTNCQSPKASPNKTTTYQVTGIARSCTQDRTHTAYITVYVNPPKGQGKISGDTVICPGKRATLSGPAGFSSYNWSNGATGRSQTVQNEGNYQLEVKSKCYTDTLSYQLKAEPPLDYRFPNDTVVCASALPIELGGWSNLPFSINFTNQTSYTVTRPIGLIYEVKGKCTSLDYYVNVDTVEQETRALATDLPDSLEQGFTHWFSFGGYLASEDGTRSYFTAADTLSHSAEQSSWLDVYQVRKNEGCSDTLFVKRITLFPKKTVPNPNPEVGECKIEVAPNPGGAAFRLSTNQALEHVVVYDAQSRKVFESSVQEAGEYTLPTIHWSSGTYYISAACADGSRVRVRWIKSK